MEIEDRNNDHPSGKKALVIFFSDFFQNVRNHCYLWSVTLYQSSLPSHSTLGLDLTRMS